MFPNHALLQTLRDVDGPKLIKCVMENSKEICKLLSGKGIDTSGVYMVDIVQFMSELSTRVQKVCSKYNVALDKADRFVTKLGHESDRLLYESKMFKTFLKHGMNSPENSSSGPSLIRILQAIYSVTAVAGSVTNPVLGIQMIVCHSNAPDIFLERHQFLSKTPNSRRKQPLKNPTIKVEPEIVNHMNEKPLQEKYSEIKTELLKLWRHLVIAFTRVSKTVGSPSDKKILENSVPYLFQMYSATMSEPDQEIYLILREYTGKRLQIQIEEMPMFGPKSLEPSVQTENHKLSNPLFIFTHSLRANTLLGLINERQAYLTAMEHNESCMIVNENHYDFRFLLPLLCHILDSKNICDAVKVISNGWIYMIVRCLSFEDPTIRNMAFLAYKLLIQNFQLPKKGYKMQDIKVWLHFLLSVRKGFQNLGRCKVSSLLSIWMVATWECIREPSHPLYQRLTTLLFAKPVVDLGQLPDFLPFYNATDGNKTSQEWILNVLTHGLQNKEDWQAAQRLPTINSLCCSFPIETIVNQRKILMIFCKGARIPEVAMEMVEKHALLLWITNIPLNINKPYGKELQELFRTLTQSCGDIRSNQELFSFAAKGTGWEKAKEMETE